MILAVGWRETFMILAGIVLSITLPVAVFIIRLTPQEKGLKAYGETEEASETTAFEIAPEAGLSLKQAAKTGEFWALCVTNLVAGLLLMGVQVHAPVFIQTVGLSSTLAAEIIAVSSIIIIPGKLLHGLIQDKFGSRVSSVYIFGAFILTLISLLLLKNTFTSFVYGVLFGLSGAITTVALPLWTVSVFGKKDYAMIFAIMSMFMTFGAAVGSPLAGFIYDNTGSYQNAWLLLITMAVMGLIITFISVGKRKPAELIVN